MPPPGAPDWERAATAWLFELCPPEYLGYPVLRRHPVVLARFAARQVSAQVSAAREGLAEVRSELREVVGPDVVTAAVNALEQEGARLLAVSRAVALVERALRGERFRARL